MTGDKTATPNGGGESKQSGSINIAASVAANWADHSAKSLIADNISITSAMMCLLKPQMMPIIAQEAQA